MEKQRHAQIYKSDLRGCMETDVFRRFSTFNFGDYQNGSRKPFGILHAFNDETLGPKHKAFNHLDEDMDVLIIPLHGSVLYTDSIGNYEVVETENIRIFSGKKGMSFALMNLYNEDLVNYLQIWLKPNSNKSVAYSLQQQFQFSNRNALCPIFTAADSDGNILKVRNNALGFIGIYEGRKEDNYTLENSANGLFAFVLNGAFEFENRLVETRDGLALNGFDSVEFEAISENAILLVLEIPIK